jgi:signal transduction histidine kinase
VDLVTNLCPDKRSLQTENSLVAQGREMVKSLGFNASLPWAIFDNMGSLRTLNSRMLKILNQKTIKLPLEMSSVQKIWPFQNEHESTLAHFKNFILNSFNEEPLRSSHAVAGLKNYRLIVKELLLVNKEVNFVPRVVVAEMLRSGDLMTDQGSRQELFRTLSHEIRTSVLSLKGYLGILEEGAKETKLSPIVDRLSPTLERLDNVVERLKDFRIELDILSEGIVVKKNNEKRVRSERRKPLDRRKIQKKQ